MDADELKRVFMAGANTLKGKSDDPTCVALHRALISMSYECMQIASEGAAGYSCEAFIIKDGIRYNCLLRWHSGRQHQMRRTDGRD